MQFNENNSKSSSTGIPKIIYDSAKHQSNILEVSRKLNFYVQRSFTGLHDCIATRTVHPIVAPAEPGANTDTTQELLSEAPPSTTSTSGTSMTLRSSASNSTTVPERSQSPTSPPSSSRSAVSEMETFRYLEKYKLYLLAQEKYKPKKRETSN
jgi:hypothetical protein